MFGLIIVSSTSLKRISYYHNFSKNATSTCAYSSEHCFHCIIFTSYLYDDGHIWEQKIIQVEVLGKSFSIGNHWCMISLFQSIHFVHNVDFLCSVFSSHQKPEMIVRCPGKQYIAKTIYINPFFSRRLFNHNNVY